MAKNVVRQIKVGKLLDEMLENNKELYEQILDSNISSSFNQIVQMAMEDSYSK